ncbi:MAG TPA: capsular biosynthesis protein [Polyangiaceae bacterium]|nr:capsular biosynthesis protein [Polyangiaceae bacterium]
MLTGRHFLMLQGPAGPFFSRVGRQLRERGARVTKVNFNGGEDLYNQGPHVVRFRAALESWPEFFEHLVRERKVSAIILFGDCRPLHRAAIERAHALGVEVFVFEEGYLRPDFVTLERGGVNGHSAIPRDPGFYDDVDLSGPDPGTVRAEHAFLKSVIHTICYATVGGLMRFRYPLYRHHRDIRPLVQASLWVRGAFRRVLHTMRDREIAARLEAHTMPPYFFVPLQVYLDSQISYSRFDTIDEFISEVVAAFARHAPSDHHLVIKLHPMDRAYSDYGPVIESLRKSLGLGERLHYVDVINLPAALRGARGTVVINSTVGLSSLLHGTPVKCLGHAVYDMHGLTHQGPIGDFFEHPTPVDRSLCRRFARWLRQNNQLNGTVWSRLYEDPARLIAKPFGQVSAETESAIPPRGWAARPGEIAG